MELQQKIRTEAESVLEEELDEKHRECEDLRQQFQHVVTETTQLTTALRRAAKEEQHSLTNIAKAEAQQAKCDLQAVTEELSDVRKVLDSHVSELIACKVSMAESDGVAAVLRRELARQKLDWPSSRQGAPAWRACAPRLWTSRTQRRAKFDSHLILLQAILFYVAAAQLRRRVSVQRIQSHTYTTARRRRLDRTFRILNT